MLELPVVSEVELCRIFPNPFKYFAVKEVSPKSFSRPDDASISKLISGSFFSLPPENSLISKTVSVVVPEIFMNIIFLF